VSSEAFANLELFQHLLNLIAAKSTYFPALISLDLMPVALNPVRAALYK
jgi:hypothetical protein